MDKNKGNEYAFLPNMPSAREMGMKTNVKYCFLPFSMRLRALGTSECANQSLAA